MSLKRHESKFFEKVQKNYSKKELDLISEAVSKLHSLNSQIFHSKEKLEENLENASILAGLNTAPQTVIAALLCSKSLGKEELDKIKNDFGEEVTALIENKTKFESTIKSEKMQNSNLETRKLFFYSLAKNVQLIILVLADRLTLLRKIYKLSEKEKNDLIEEQKEILIPLAHKMGTINIKSEAEDLVFKNTNPKKYFEILSLVEKERKERKKEIEKISEMLQKQAREKNISVKISGRAKSIYSIFNKMASKNKTINQIHDIIALRVICNEVKNCYEMLGVAHSLWKPIPEEFDDYITKPKPNNYRSLHTTVLGAENKAFEMQIRTKEMHNEAEFGMAPHWKYKGREEQKVFDRKISWLSELLSWQKELKQAPMRVSKIDFFGDSIYVLSPKGDTIELQAGATVLDFAYAIHEDIGNRCAKAKVNQQIVPINHALETADLVEIITSFSQKPKLQWLNFAVTEKAKKKIKQFLQLSPPRITPLTRPDKGTLKTSDKKAKIAKCCLPVPGDKIIGFRTTKRKISVHRIDCSEIIKFQPITKTPVVWDVNKSLDYTVELQVVGSERPGLLSDILNTFSVHNITVLDAKAKLGKSEAANCQFKIETKNLAELEKTIEKLKAIDAIKSVQRV
ncbi:MAG: bifunctional (p)ppGpp synthetase/guanosine-3',5'-bis(diphosphate) 3'-pyrophosphohydrolase [Candidatus Diapherotrites archaeon]|nr:bifunctional (p)ppGpp synthetase/guanosine-3',5'-bis(diphosphate) 3'-pyrophosphohydrolase [Candidatus Diapherotrites archaeon]